MNDEPNQISEKYFYTDQWKRNTNEVYDLWLRVKQRAVNKELEFSKKIKDIWTDFGGEYVNKTGPLKLFANFTANDGTNKTFCLSLSFSNNKDGWYPSGKEQPGKYKLFDTDRYYHLSVYEERDFGAISESKGEQDRDGKIQFLIESPTLFKYGQKLFEDFFTYRNLFEDKLFYHLVDILEVKIKDSLPLSRYPSRDDVEKIKIDNVVIVNVRGKQFPFVLTKSNYSVDIDYVPDYSQKTMIL